MSKSKRTTRRNSDLESNVQPTTLKDELHRSIFLLSESLLSAENITFFQLRHPSTERKSYYYHCSKTKKFFQLIQFKEPNRCFFIDESICSNGVFYITVPFDVTFLFLYHIRKNCQKKAISIDQIEDEEFMQTSEFLVQFNDENLMQKIADIKKSQGTSYYLYNKSKTLAWLAIKVYKLAEKLLNNKAVIAGGTTSISSNYIKSEVLHQTSKAEYFQQACDIIGSFISSELKSELLSYFSLSSTNIKRKSVKTVENDSKKFKGEIAGNDLEIKSPPQAVKKPKQGAKEIKLAKAAAGSKSIASFFKK